MAKKSTSKKPVKIEQAATRPVIHPEVVVEYAWGDSPVTVEHAKLLMGMTWDKEEAKAYQSKYGLKFFDPLFKDADGKPVWCMNNINNRPFYESNFQDLIQKILTRHWAGPNGTGFGHTQEEIEEDHTINGEPIIIGRTGLVLNGQHTLPALVVADQLRQKHIRWSEVWDGECVIDKLIVYGLSENDMIVNTMDTCKPRSLADVIYRSEYFRNKAPDERKAASKITDHCIRLLWHRTGTGKDSFSPRRTHDEALLFLSKHPHVMRCVSHIYAENKEGSIKDYVSLGFAAGMMYLMAASHTDDGVYTNAVRNGEAKEDVIDFEYWDKAVDFWAKFGNQQEGSMNVIRKALTLAATNSEKLAVLAKAWNHYLTGNKFTESVLKLKTRPNDQGVPVLSECPDVGGIDLGDPSERGEDGPKGGDPKPEQIEEAKKEIIKQREQNRDKRNGVAPKGEAPAPSKKPVKTPPKKTPVKK